MTTRSTRSPRAFFARSTAFIPKPSGWCWKTASASRAAVCWRNKGRLAMAVLALVFCSACAHKVKLKALPMAKGGDIALQVQLTYDRNNLLSLEVKGPGPETYGP